MTDEAVYALAEELASTLCKSVHQERKDEKATTVYPHFFVPTARRIIAAEEERNDAIMAIRRFLGNADGTLEGLREVIRQIDRESARKAVQRALEE